MREIQDISPGGERRTWWLPGLGVLVVIGGLLPWLMHTSKAPSNIQAPSKQFTSAPGSAELLPYHDCARNDLVQSDGVVIQPISPTGAQSNIVQVGFKDLFRTVPKLRRRSQQVDPILAAEQAEAAASIEADQVEAAIEVVESAARASTAKLDSHPGQLSKADTISSPNESSAEAATADVDLFEEITDRPVEDAGLPHDQGSSPLPEIVTTSSVSTAAEQNTAEIVPPAGATVDKPSALPDFESPLLERARMAAQLPRTPRTKTQLLEVVHPKAQQGVAAIAPRNTGTEEQLTAVQRPVNAEADLVLLRQSRKPLQPIARPAVAAGSAKAAGASAWTDTNHDRHGPHSGPYNSTPSKPPLIARKPVPYLPARELTPGSFLPTAATASRATSQAPAVASVATTRVAELQTSNSSARTSDIVPTGLVLANRPLTLPAKALAVEVTGHGASLVSPLSPRQLPAEVTVSSGLDAVATDDGGQTAQPAAVNSPAPQTAVPSGPALGDGSEADPDAVAGPGIARVGFDEAVPAELSAAVATPQGEMAAQARTSTASHSRRGDISRSSGAPSPLSPRMLASADLREEPAGLNSYDWPVWVAAICCGIATVGWVLLNWWGRPRMMPQSVMVRQPGQLLTRLKVRDVSLPPNEG